MIKLTLTRVYGEEEKKIEIDRSETNMINDVHFFSALSTFIRALSMYLFVSALLLLLLYSFAAKNKITIKWFFIYYFVRFECVLLLRRRLFEWCALGFPIQIEIVCNSFAFASFFSNSRWNNKKKFFRFIYTTFSLFHAIYWLIHKN